MKLASFAYQGRRAYGVLQSGRYLLPPDGFLARCPDLASVLNAQALGALADAVRSAGTDLDPAETQALPAVPAPGKFICVGLNYKSHVAETRRDDSAYPSLFVRFQDTLAADGDAVARPDFSDRFDFEGELAVVVGRGGRHIDRADAMGHVAGYACFNDITVRDWQRHTHQWTPGKNFPGTGPLGPWLVTADEVPDTDALTLETRLNGQVVQHASVADLIYTLPVVIAYLSGFTTLSPGDVIATGTPGGVGDRRVPPVYMKDGDLIEVEISGLGVLRNRIVTAA